MFGTLGDIRECLDYFKDKPLLNLIDKRLLLGIFQKEVEISDSIICIPDTNEDSKARSALDGKLIQGNDWHIDTPKFKNNKDFRL